MSDLITEVGLTDLKNGEIETDEFRKFHVNLKNLPDKCYNELSERERYFKLFLIDDIEELNKISMGDDIMKKVVETVKSLSSDPIFMTELEKKQLDEYCNRTAIIDAKREEQVEIAKKSLDENIDIETISKITGLTVEEINNL